MTIIHSKISSPGAPFPFLLLISFLVLPMAESFAQEIRCNVNCNFEAVAAANKDLLTNFQSDISNYFLNYPWGNDSDIKVKAEISIFIQSATGDNRYSAQAVIVSQ